MIRIVYIGEKNINRINTIHKLDNIILNQIESYNYNDIINKLPTDVIDLFIINNPHISKEILMEYAKWRLEYADFNILTLSKSSPQTIIIYESFKTEAFSKFTI
jgi:hypothetical protein